VALAAIGLWYDDYAGGSASPVTPQLVNVLSFNAGITHNDTTFQACFPYVQEPWRGFVGDQYVGPRSIDPLPVNFLEFTAAKSGNKVQLRWKVSEAVNNNYFEVQHSLDGSTFITIGKVDARNGSSATYIFNDHNPSMNGINYYRIKEVDRDGKFFYSVIQSVNFSGSGKFTVSPNPAKDFINVYSSQENTKIYLFDASGKRMSVSTVNKGSVRIDLSKLPKGVYNVVFEKDGIKTDVQKVVIQ